MRYIKKGIKFSNPYREPSVVVVNATLKGKAHISSRKEHPPCTNNENIKYQ